MDPFIGPEEAAGGPSITERGGQWDHGHWHHHGSCESTQRSYKPSLARSDLWRCLHFADKAELACVRLTFACTLAYSSLIDHPFPLFSPLLYITSVFSFHP
jgi:hypothetical protein